ncbi:hypothetical protein HY632_05095 [Candidatus Uhrbacteria bacterium]|nr:hypothetical protein [Candidatus Uhrbacteria bacterium]
MAANGTQRYTGRIISVHHSDGGKFAWISHASILTEEGTPVTDLGTEDVFLHQDGCAVQLTVGTVVSFSVVEDRKRNNGCWRANGATELVEPEALPEDDPVVLHIATLPPEHRTTALALPIPPHPWRNRMKPVAAAVVGKVVENEPLPEQTHDETRAVAPDDPRVAEALSRYLRCEYPNMEGLGLGYDIVGVDEEEFQRTAATAIEELRGMEMHDQAAHVEEEIQRFLGVRKVLTYLHANQLLRPNTFVHKRYLVDLFAAGMVWFFALRPNEKDAAQKASEEDDPIIHPAVRYLCDCYPQNQRWAHLFQMFNRRVRPLTAYKGDVMPMHILRLIREAQQHFDYVVVATPYYDIAGKEWSDPRWLRSLDPYVFGFQRGCEHFFVLGRFSDSGVFPHHAELVADGIEFLRSHREQLKAFNDVSAPYWLGGSHVSGDGNAYWPGGLGDELVQFTDQLLAAFDAGHLFDWIRGEWELPLAAALKADTATP